MWSMKYVAQNTPSTIYVCSEGTHFYHAHTGSIRAEGTTGLIIFRNESPRDVYDAELSLILSDWYHEEVTALSTGLFHK